MKKFISFAVVIVMLLTVVACTVAETTDPSENETTDYRYLSLPDTSEEPDDPPPPLPDTTPDETTPPPDETDPPRETDPPQGGNQTPPNQPAVLPTGVSVNQVSVTLDIGAGHTFVATVAPANATNRTVTWTSSNNAVATVNNTGRVTAVAAGTATITARTHNGQTATATVTVMQAGQPQVLPTGITIDRTALTLTATASHLFVPNVAPANATNQTVTWTSSNNSVATVNSAGRVTAVAAGTATITARTHNGHTVTSTLTVRPIPATPAPPTPFPGRTLPPGEVAERYLNFSAACRAAFGAQATERFLYVFDNTWLEIAHYFARNGQPFRVTLIASPNTSGAPGWASGTTTWVRANWMQQRPNDIDILVHEIAHNAQAYGGGRPGFIVEGIAEYVRDRWGMFNQQEGWSLPARPPANASYHPFPGHRESGSFIRFLVSRDPSFAVDINRAAQQSGAFGYNEARMWTYQRTGFTLQQLWNMWVGRPVGDTVLPNLGAANANQAAGGGTVVSGAQFIRGGTGMPNEGPQNLFNTNANSKFVARVDGTNNNFWVEWRYDTAIVPDRFIFSTANDTAGFGRRMGNGWRILGSNDGTNWTTLHTGTANDSGTDVNNRFFYVNLTTTQAFTHFRLEAPNSTSGVEMTGAILIQLAWVGISTRP